jgi:uncharacterized membrane protein
MNISDENEIKKEFQLERLIFFSDAVFAIIITIMILDVRLPEALVHPTEDESKSALLQVLPKVLLYAVSFNVIGGFWMRHLKIFSFLKDYNAQLLVINLLFLFSVSLFPFALSFFFTSSNITQYTWGIYTYIGIIYFVYFTQTLLIHYLIRNKEVLCVKTDQIENALMWKVRRLSYFLIPVYVIIITGASYFQIDKYFVFGVLLFYGIVIRILKKRWYPDYKNERVTLFSFFKKARVIKSTVRKAHK